MSGRSRAVKSNWADVRDATDVLMFAAARRAFTSADGDQLHGAVDAPLQVFDVELSRFVVADHLDDRAGALGDLQVRDGVAGVLRARGEDPVAGFEGQRVEARLP